MEIIESLEKALDIYKTNQYKGSDSILELLRAENLPLHADSTNSYLK